MWLEFQIIHIQYRAAEPVVFPRSKPGNVLRGGFGAALKHTSPDMYARLFEPTRALTGPSGLREPARLFVFRAGHLDGRRFEAGEDFAFDLHLFDMRPHAGGVLTGTFGELGREGLGYSRGRAELVSSAIAVRRIPLEPDRQSTPRTTIEFVTPTELKSSGEIVTEPLFPVLLARARDRVSVLRSLTGLPPLDIDYRQLGEDAKTISMTRCELRVVHAMRRSARTGQRHSVGGFLGSADYEGELREFLPWLRAAQFTGVGRHTAWGQGEIRVLSDQ